MSDRHVIGWTITFPRESWCVACMPNVETLHERLESLGFRNAAVTTVYNDDRTNVRCWHCDETLLQVDRAGQRALDIAMQQLLGD